MTRFILALALAGSFSLSVSAQSIDLPSSKTLQPVPGSPQPTNSFSSAVALSPGGKYLAILNSGYGSAESKFEQSIALLDTATKQLRDFPDARLGQDARQTYFVGLAWSSDGRELYASMASITDPEGKKAADTGNGIAVYRFENGGLVAERFLKLPLVALGPHQRFTYEPKAVPKGSASPYPAGLAVIKSDGGDRLLIAENLADDAVLIDAGDGHILHRYTFAQGATVPSQFPYAVIASRDGRHAWCSLWNGSAVAELDLVGGKLVHEISLLPPKSVVDPSSHPTQMALSTDGKTLYLALANRDVVAVISTSDSKVERYLDTRLPGQTYGGAYPDALALSADGTKLYVANASSDAVAVFDLSASGMKPDTEHAEYFIPTEWYPTAVALHDDELFIATGKGRGTGPNSIWKPNPKDPERRKHPYIATLICGSIAAVNVADAERRRNELTSQVLETNLMNGRTGEVRFRSGANPIHHVIYIIKENRTYDQVFGDIAEANGDPSLVMYGEQITPNQHELARQFGVLDNFYDSGEVSGDGHVWSTSAITSDYTEQTWAIAFGYRGKERNYDYEGWVGKSIPAELGIPDVDDPGTGYLWGNLARHKLTYRHYGEFVTTTWCIKSDDDGAPSLGGLSEHQPNCPRDAIRPGEDLPANLGSGKSPYPYTIPLIAYDTATKPELQGHFDSNYADFKLDYPDQFRADEFLHEFDGFVKARQSGHGDQLPQFMLLRLPDDHTAGTRPGFPRPNASVADNDLAVGRVVEAVSHSPYWDDTAIFILEDDAQNGVDHVDAHRSTALVISKYSPGTAQQPAIDHHFYTTVNMIHTMEVLLGLPPMNNNDAYAPVMTPLFAGAGDQPPFAADYRNRDNGVIYEVNPPKGPGAKESAKMNFSVADAADADKLNAILWRAAKGNVTMPRPQHNVFPAGVRRDPDD